MFSSHTDAAGNDLKITTVSVKPFAGQRPGTSGLWKKTKEFMQPGYVEAFVQSTFNAMRGLVSGDFSNSTLVVGADWPDYNKEAIQKILHVAIGNESAADSTGSIDAISASGTTFRTASPPRRPLPNGFTNLVSASTTITGSSVTTSRSTKWAHRRTRSPKSRFSIRWPLQAFMNRLFDFDALRKFFQSGFRIRMTACTVMPGRRVCIQ